jgi:hypothetical protein
MHKRTDNPLVAAIRSLLAGWVAALILLAGCQPSDMDAVIVEGDVRYAGQPVGNGDIQFVPIEGTKGPASGAPIVDGHYRVEAKGGVPIGTHRVMIRGFRAANAPTGQSDVPGMGGTGRLQFIPPKYSSPRSTLTATIEQGPSPITRDFDLQP